MIWILRKIFGWRTLVMTFTFDATDKDPEATIVVTVHGTAKNIARLSARMRYYEKLDGLEPTAPTPQGENHD